MSEERQRTMLDLDLALVREAAEVLQSEGITDTVHAALSAVVKRHKLEQLLDYDFLGLTLESLEEARGQRMAGPIQDSTSDGFIDPVTPL